MQIWRYVVIVFAVFAGLGGCQTTAPVPPATTADEFVPLAMNARRLEIIDNWQMPVEPPYIGHRAQTLPSNLLAKWASQVLQPAGGSGELVFDISRASVTRIALPLEAGIKTLLPTSRKAKSRQNLMLRLCGCNRLVAVRLWCNCRRITVSQSLNRPTPLICKMPCRQR